MLASKSYAQLDTIFEFYEGIAGKSIEATIESELSGNVKEGMLAIIQCARSKPKYFAERLYKSMKGG